MPTCNKHLRASEVGRSSKRSPRTLGARGKGDLFELLTKHYLLLNPTYNTTLSDVWLLDEVPEKLRASLNLPQGDGH